MELTAAEPRRKGLVQLYLDGEEAVKLDREVFLRAGLRPGDQISDEELHQLILDSDARRARNHSKRELTEKIARTAASWEAAEAAAGQMEELGLVDDQAYARDRAREMFLRKRWGPLRVKQELRRKGIDGELIEELLEEYRQRDEGGLVAENVRAVLETKYSGWREDEKQRRRAFAALQRRGYSYEEIREGMAWDEFEAE